MEKVEDILYRDMGAKTVKKLLGGDELQPDTMHDKIMFNVHSKLYDHLNRDKDTRVFSRSSLNSLADKTLGGAV